MKINFYLSMLFIFNVLSVEYSNFLNDAINKGDAKQVSFLIKNYGPFDKSSYDKGLEVAAKNKNGEMFNALSIYASKTAHKNASKIWNK